MPSPRYKNAVLNVIPVEGSPVREIDTATGRPLMNMRRIGHDEFGNMVFDVVVVPYHTHYIALLKEGSLKAADLQTAQLAGVSL